MRKTGLFALIALLLSGLLFLAGCRAAETSPDAGEGEQASALEGEAADTATEESDLLPVDYAKWETSNPGEYGDYNQRANLIQRGADVYDKYCVGCHGEYGDGYGPATERLITRPRDFTSGIYKFRSTDSGSLPLEADLHRTITRGLARVSMPAFRLMAETDKLAVIEYIKAFYPRWDDERGARTVVPLPQAPADLADSRRVRRGRVVYLEMQCNQCHGVDGQGTGATQTEYVDAWGDQQKPFDFTRGALKGGDTAEDIYRTFHTGLRSVMPAYGGETLAAAAQESFLARAETTLDAAERQELAEVLADFPEQASQVFNDMTATERQQIAVRNSWDLVAYILSLRQTTTTAGAVLGG